MASQEDVNKSAKQEIEELAMSDTREGRCPACWMEKQWKQERRGQTRKINTPEAGPPSDGSQWTIASSNTIGAVHSR